MAIVNLLHVMHLTDRMNAINLVLEYVFTVPMFAGEFGFGLWLLFRGGKAVS